MHTPSLALCLTCREHPPIAPQSPQLNASPMKPLYPSHPWGSSFPESLQAWQQPTCTLLYAAFSYLHLCSSQVGWKTQRESHAFYVFAPSPIVCLTQNWKDMCAKSLQSCQSHCDPRDCSLPISSVHGILQARILCSGLTFPSPGDLPKPEMEPVSSALHADSLPLNQ